MGSIFSGPTIIAGDFDLPSIALNGLPHSGYFALNDGVGLSFSSQIFWFLNRSIFQVGPKQPPTGQLAALAGSPYASINNPIGIGVHPNGKFCYTANRLTNNLRGYAINPATGTLTELATSPFAAGVNPDYLTISPNGLFLYVTNNGAAQVGAYSINQATGTLTLIGNFACGFSPEGISTDFAGQFLYVANNAGNSISAYSIDQVTGSLTALAGSPFSSGGNSPFKITTTRNGFLYVANRLANTVAGFSINPVTGNLTPVPNSPFAVGQSPRGIFSDPLGRFVFVGNFTDSTISAFIINNVTGNLTPVSGSPFATAVAPSDVFTDALGEICYVISNGTSQISSYLINDVTGNLTFVGTFATGVAPVSAAADPTNKFVYVANSGGNTISGFSTSTVIPKPLFEGNFDLSGGGNNRLNINGELWINGAIQVVPPLAAGIATFLATPTSANLAAAVTDETGTGALVFATNPVLVTPKATTTIGVGNATPAATGAGVSFPAAQSASADANTLDDYEEGTWVPAVSSSVGVITSYTLEYAQYTKIGRSVSAKAQITITNAGTGSGGVNITMPFANGLGFSVAGCGDNGANGKSLSVSIAPSSVNTYVVLFDGTTAVATGAILNVNITYDV